jgi:hypothetical protein
VASPRRKILGEDSPCGGCVDPGAFTLRVDLHRVAWPDHRAKTHAHETLLWASEGGGSRYTFNYDLINGADPKAQLSSVWSIPYVSKREKLYGYHPTRKPLRFLRRAIVASSKEGELGPFLPSCS